MVTPWPARQLQDSTGRQPDASRGAWVRVSVEGVRLRVGSCVHGAAQCLHALVELLGVTQPQNITIELTAGCAVSSTVIVTQGG